MKQEWHRNFMGFVALLLVVYTAGIAVMLLRIGPLSVSPMVFLLLVLLGYMAHFITHRVGRGFDPDGVVPDYNGAFATMGTLMANVETGMAIAFVLAWFTFILPNMKRRTNNAKSAWQVVVLVLYDVLEYLFLAGIVGVVAVWTQTLPGLWMWVLLPVWIFVTDYLNMAVSLTGIALRAGRPLRLVREQLGLHALKQNVFYYLFFLFSPPLAFAAYREAGALAVLFLVIVMIPGLHSGYLFIQLHESQQKRQTDTLTQLRNGHGFRMMSDELTEGQAELAVMILDLDRFKQINDRYGHPVGDRTLVAFAVQMSSLLQPYAASCELFRLHGDEFAVLIQDVSLVEPLNALMRENRDSFFVITDDERIPIPFSAGCQVLEPGMDTHDLIKKADAAMYVTKSLRYLVP